MLQENEIRVPLKDYIASFLIFSLIPTIGLLYGFSLVGKVRDLVSGKRNLFLFFFLLASWLGFINMTKCPASDQVAYLGLFKDAGVIGFHDTVYSGLNGGGKEFLYGLFTWLSHYIFFNNGALFFYVITVIIYMLHFVSVYRVFRKMSLSVGALICGVLTLAFFTQYFTLTNHLVRQMLGASIAVYGICDRACGGRRWYVWLIAAVLFHTSTVLMVTMAFVPAIYRKMSASKIIPIGSLFFAFVVVVSSFSVLLTGFIEDDSTFSYGMSKLASDGNEEEQELRMPLYLLLMVIVPLSMGIIYSFKREKKDNSPVYPLGYICVGLCVFVLAMSRNPLIQNRFFYFTYSFIPFFIPLLLGPYSLVNIYYKIIPLLFACRFFYLHESQVWVYGKLYEILIYPFWFYLTSSPLV